MIAEIDELMREKFGSVNPKGGGDGQTEAGKKHRSESELWSSQKTADKLGIGKGQVSEAKTAEVCTLRIN
ncbi:hypothetical protein KA005_14940 [bacterium]|nr:hypothetical protein [bacterium]